MLGGKAGSRLLAHLYMPTSHDTLLRLIRKWQPGTLKTPTALGVDDWAIRKAKTYSTILVDLNRHQPIDLLEGRTAEALRDCRAAGRLRIHPGVEVITRDRSGEYARGAREGAPQAQQVADRWHLLQNLEPHRRSESVGTNTDQWLSTTSYSTHFRYGLIDIIT